MSAYTNFQDGDTLTAEKLNEAFGLIDTKVDLVLPAAQEAVETASQTATAVAEMSRVMTETFARQQAEIDAAVESVADKTSKSYVDAGDEANAEAIDELEESIGDAIGQAINVCKSYTDNTVEDSETAITTAYLAADAEVFDASKLYTRNQITSATTELKDYADDCAAGALDDAKDYADGQDATNLLAAKSYTDSAIAGIQPATTYKLAFVMEVGDTSASVTKNPALVSSKNWEVTLYTEDPEFVPATFTHTFNTFNATDVFTITFPEITDANVSGYLKIVEVS